MRRGSFLSLPWPVLLLGFALAQPAMAYTDPGSGALLWQVIASAFIAVLFYFRKILTWVRRKRDNPRT